MQTAGDKKISTDPFSEQTEEQKAVQKELMGSLHDTFISFVKERRGSALVDPMGQDVFSGRVWTGADAVKVGVIDKVGTLHEVRVQELLGAGVFLHAACRLCFLAGAFRFVSRDVRCSLPSTWDGLRSSGLRGDG